MGFGGFEFMPRLIITLSAVIAVLITYLGLIHMRWVVLTAVAAVMIDLVYIVAGMVGV